MKRALFLDRDGIVDELVFYESSGEWEAPRRVEDIRMIEGAAAALQRFADAGWLLFFITNQPNVAKGKAAREDVEAVHAAGAVLHRHREAAGGRHLPVIDTDG